MQYMLSLYALCVTYLPINSAQVRLSPLGAAYCFALRTTLQCYNAYNTLNTL